MCKGIIATKINRCLWILAVFSYSFYLKLVFNRIYTVSAEQGLIWLILSIFEVFIICLYMSLKITITDFAQRNVRRPRVIVEKKRSKEGPACSHVSFRTPCKLPARRAHVLQRQKTVTAFLASKQLLHINFTGQNGCTGTNGTHASSDKWCARVTATKIACIFFVLV